MPKLRRNAQGARCGRGARGVFLPVAKTHFVDQGGSKDVGIAHRHAIHVQFLRAVAVSAAIGDTGKRRGHQLRIVNLAVAPEDLVMIVEMLVDAYVEGVLAGGVDRRGLVVVLDAAQVLRWKELEKLDGVRIEATGGQLIVGKRLPDIPALGGHDSGHRI